MKPKRTLFRKLLIIFILIGIIPPLVLTLLGFTFSSKILQDAIYDEAYDSLININKNIDTFLNEYKTIVNMISTDSKLHKTLSGNEISDDYYYEINQKIYLLLASKKYKFPIYILDTKGNAIFETSPLPQMYKNNLQNGWGVFRKMDEDKEIVLYPEKFTNNMGETIVFSMGKKIYDNNNNPVGYIIIDIKRNAIVDIINTIGNSKLIDVMLLDEFYYIITDANHPEKEGLFWDSPYRDTVAKNNKGKINIRENNKIPSFMVYYTYEPSTLRTVATVPLNIVQQNNSNIRKTIIQSLLISLTLAVLISLIVANYMIRPIKKLVKSMKRVEEGDLTIQINLHRNDELGMLENSFNQMVVRLKESIDNAIDKQRRLRIAEINILQAQIKPHFLYNTLDAIKWIAKLNNVKEIGVIATQLGSLLRNSINCEQEFLTVKDNLDLINNYLEIQKIRYNDGFDVNIATDDETLGYYIPKLILQPIVENAIVHGFENIDEKGMLIIRGYRKEDNLYFEVLDNGIGMNEEQIEEALSKTNDDHIGLYNVDQRVKLYYGSLSGVTIESKPDKGTKVIIKIPIKAYYKDKY
ncbi:sensor histidine kinase [Vallitalea guaymasensis]|uniref:histidine kinase n=1 Tax=Vallitalea guaymasensis TaxID=1185412 RepID=A0A8J8M9W0_9FIRM|nr:sensor histidine kinase [Vallitalea guaymasensis]QUH29057.1 sensor histidine kinase [Vallitalea guaymasensis]